MKREHGEPETAEQRVIQRRRRAFAAALAATGETQSTWAAKHHLSQQIVSGVLIGRETSARVLGLIYTEINRAMTTAPDVLEAAQ